MAIINGTITLNNGDAINFQLDGSQYSGYEFGQWGGSYDTLCETYEALEAMAKALDELGFDPEPECEECGCEIERGETLCEDCEGEE